MDELDQNQSSGAEDVRSEGAPARRRVERVVFETERQLVAGDLTLPPAGYKSRFSDALNRDELEFVSLTDVEITSLADGEVKQLPFLVLSKRQIQIAYPAER
jgi:hypothetical protein